MSADHEHKPRTITEHIFANTRIGWECGECGNYFTRDGKLPPKRLREMNTHWPNEITRVRKAGTVGCPIRGDMCWSCNKMWDLWCRSGGSDKR